MTTRVIASAKNIRVSAQKCRLVADLIRNLSIDNALSVLNFSRQKSAKLIKKTLESAIANAEHNQGIDIDELLLKEIYIDKGPSLKRFSARAKGRGNSIEKQTCHINIVVGY